MSNHIYPDQSDSAFDMKYTRAKVLPSDLRSKTSNGETRIIGSGIQENATNDPYVLPIASDAVLGGIKVGTGLTIDVDGTLNSDAPAGGGAWGEITGDITDQADLIGGDGKILPALLPDSGGGGTWGTITGDLTDQTDLNNALEELQAQINAGNSVGNKLFNYYNFI